ncbi:hypothetical protein EZS27_014621 [termite gut metagenome]|uniref:Uncharacterized protein n=1 Tax=termite gut metagenome TaxID=433724 RepID=A0A5J4RWH2_9ZZZZ
MIPETELDLLNRIKNLLDTIDKTKVYKSKEIYQLYNEAFQKHETVSTCMSCLKRRTEALKKYYNDNKYKLVPVSEEDNKIEKFITNKLETSDAVILTTSDWKGEISDAVIIQKPE